VTLEGRPQEWLLRLADGTVLDARSVRRLGLDTADHPLVADLFTDGSFQPAGVYWNQAESGLFDLAGGLPDGAHYVVMDLLGDLVQPVLRFLDAGDFNVDCVTRHL